MTISVSGTPIRAVAYVRMSTDHQKYSTLNQLSAIEGYAVARGMVIVRIYADEGKSGLRVERRDGLKKLLGDVVGGSADFEAILVYDVSRWGRFQDVDESAYHEFICKQGGMQVHYCAEQFENDGSPLSAIVKGIKRVMAGEFSRELSVKAFLGQSRLVKLGYSPGASAPFGLRRLLVDQKGVPKGVLARGERKSIQNDRVIFIPGPSDEVKIVRWIFETYATRKMRGREIARTLNRRGIRNVVGNAWTWSCVRDVLTNERYIGNNVWNRTSGRLKAKRTKNQRELWVRGDSVFESIVSRQLFEAAQEVIRDGCPKPTDEELLKPVRRLLSRYGFLTANLIRRNKGMPSIKSLSCRFGGLLRAYERAGFISKYRERKCRRSVAGGTHSLSNERLLEALRQLWSAHGTLSQKLIDATPEMPCVGTYQKRFGSLKHAYELIGYLRRPWPSRMRGVAWKLSDEQTLDKLRTLLKHNGYLTNWLIDDCKEIPSTSTFRYRFGSLTRAYELIGYRVGRNLPDGCRKDRQRLPDANLLEVLKRLWLKHGRLTNSLIDESAAVPAASTFRRRFGSLPRAYELIGYAPQRRGQPLRSVKARAGKRHVLRQRRKARA